MWIQVAFSSCQAAFTQAMSLLAGAAKLTVQEKELEEIDFNVQIAQSLHKFEQLRRGDGATRSDRC
jgi:hypothetical protein